MKTNDLAKLTTAQQVRLAVLLALGFDTVSALTIIALEELEG